MKKRFLPGKVPWDRIGESVCAKLPPEVVLGPALGEDAALVRIGDELWAISSDPITFTARESGKLSVIVNANDVAVRGAVPRYYSVIVLFSPDEADEESVGRILGEIRSACERLNIALIGGHTEVAPGLDHTVIAGTMLGRVSGRAITTGGLKEGDIVGMTKWAGMEGTSILLAEFGELLKEIHGHEALDSGDEVFRKDWLSIVPEAVAAAACPHVTALHDVTEGGIGEALYEIATASGLHIEVNPERIPVLAQTRLVCGDFGMDPFGLIGSGSLLIGCGQAGKTELEQTLAGLDIPFTWIGTAKKADVSRSGALPRFERDEILKAWLVDGMEACVFDMDGTLIDSDYDWSAIRAMLGVDGGSIVDSLNSLKGKEREEKWQKLRDIEKEKTLGARIRPGVNDLLTLLRQKGIKTALVTNNSDDSASYLLEKFKLSFDVVMTRDSGLYKPSGAPIAEAVNRLGVSPDKTLCVGDSLYDILASRDAGCRCVCILFDEEQLFASQADLSFPDAEGFFRYLGLALREM